MLELREKTLVTAELPMDTILEEDSEESNVLDDVDRSLTHIGQPFNSLKVLERQGVTAHSAA